MTTDYTKYWTFVLKISFKCIIKVWLLLENFDICWKVRLLSEKSNFCLKNFLLCFGKIISQHQNLATGKIRYPTVVALHHALQWVEFFDNPSKSTRWVRHHLSRGERDCLTDTGLKESSNTSWFIPGEGDQLTSEWSWSFNTRWAWGYRIFNKGMRQHQRWGDRDHHLTHVRWARSSYMMWVRSTKTTGEQARFTRGDNIHKVSVIMWPQVCVISYHTRRSWSLNTWGEHWSRSCCPPSSRAIVS